MGMQFTGAGNGADWEPSVRYLLVLVIFEIFLFGLLRAVTKHGG